MLPFLICALLTAPAGAPRSGMVTEIELVHEGNETLLGKIQGRYKDGERNGMWVGFWPDGTKRWAATYIAGKRHALFMAWRQDGTLAQESYYRHGRLHGVHTEYADNGATIARRVRYAGGVVTGD